MVLFGDGVLESPLPSGGLLVVAARAWWVVEFAFAFAFGVVGAFSSIFVGKCVVPVGSGDRRASGETFP